jgi:hypothetical protein
MAGAPISPPGEKQPRLPITFPMSEYEWLREAAFRRRVAMAELVRLALREYRERLEPQLDLPISAEDRV